MTQINKYRPLYRPATTASLPRGLQWIYVEAPPYITKRPDLPRSRFQHGVIGTERKLSKDEINRFDLQEI